MIAIVDYGLGNTEAFINSFKRLGHSARRVREPEDFIGATKLVLPGVGSFDTAMQLLNASALRPQLEDHAIRRCLPLLGVCVGMQMLAQSSTEGRQAGLGWIAGEVRGFDALGARKPKVIPHMGWNQVRPSGASGLFSGLGTDARFYFLHSYYFESADPQDVIAHTDYHIRFASAIQRDNIYGVQFHPEKSHHWGSRMLENFAKL